MSKSQGKSDEGSGKCLPLFQTPVIFPTDAANNKEQDWRADHEYDKWNLVGVPRPRDDSLAKQERNWHDEGYYEKNVHGALDSQRHVGAAIFGPKELQDFSEERQQSPESFMAVKQKPLRQ